MKQGPEAFMGPFGKGSRNGNGGYMATFLEGHRLYAANTHFRHPLKHRFSWCSSEAYATGRYPNRRAPFRNQIDYILIPLRFKHGPCEARSYHGHLKSSDHALVIMDFNMSAVYSARSRYLRTEDRSFRQNEGMDDPHWTRDIQKQPKCKSQSVDVSKLVGDPLKKRYQEALSQRLGSNEGPLSPEQIQDCIESVALDILPEKIQSSCRVKYFEDEKLQEWCKEQRSIRLELQKTQVSGEDKQSKINRKRYLSNLISRRINYLQRELQANLAKELEETAEVKRRYDIHRILRKKDYRAFELADDDGYRSHSAPKLIQMVTTYYNNFFNPPNVVQVDVWGSDHGPLNSPIQADEVAKAMARTQNGRAAGLDGIPGELLKYGGDKLAFALAFMFNQMFATCTYIQSLGEGILIPLNKPGKPKLANHVRPITLLSSTRKLFSLIILERIYPAVEKFIPISQCGFQRGKGTMDVAWDYSWLRSACWRYQRVYHVAGIDMSAAFDTIERGKLLHVLESFLHIDELRLVRVLLGNTTLTVKVMGMIGPKFSTTRGTPQGDGLSPILFVIYLEAAMRELRMLDESLFGPLNGKYWQCHIVELSYADDVDLVHADVAVLDRMLERLTHSFKEGYNLQVNMGKTERKIISSNCKTATSYKKLGGHLDADVDIKLRIQKANLAFYSMWKTWNSGEISLPVRVRLYNACILSILLFNVASGAYGEVHLRSLESAHRRHLRILLRVRWPTVVKNEDVYFRTKSEPIRTNILRARWRYMRKALLRVPGDNPHRSIMHTYFHFLSYAPKIKGAVPNTLSNLLHKDLMRVGRSLKSLADYETLKLAAGQPREWKELIERIISTSIDQLKFANLISYGKRKEREARKELERSQGIIRPGRRRLNATERDPEELINQTPAPATTVVPAVPIAPPEPMPTITHVDVPIPTNKRKDPDPDEHTISVDSIAKRIRLRREQVNNLGSIVRNSRRSDGANVYSSVNLGRDI